MTSARLRSGRGWRATVVGLHLVFVVLLSIAALSTQIARVEGSWAVTLGALAVLALAYLLLGAPAIGADHPVRAVGYLVVLVAVFAVLGWHPPSCCSCSSSPIPRCGFSWRRSGRVCSGR